MLNQINKCSWATTHPLLLKYHDSEWGKPLHNKRKLFEALCLDGAQSGLSWLIILKKRPEYRKAFANFDPKKIARFTDKDVARLMKNAGIIRNLSKIKSFINNAQAYLKVEKEFGSFDKFLWQFVDHKIIINHYKKWADIPAFSKKSEAMSKALRQAGFSFVGPTVCYAFMQGVGMINDHESACAIGKRYHTMSSRAKA